jgi:teichuronic acid biosynthesis glycosyltransferase TuaG
MFFSVVIPSYNAEESIAETIESVLKQKCRNFEVLVVDDASTDRTLKIAETYAAQDDRLRIIRCERRSGGPATPRNRGISESRGEYIAFLDADDIWGEDKLLNDAEFLGTCRPDICFSGAQYFRRQRKNTAHLVAPKPIGWAFLFRNTVPLSTVCINRDALAAAQLGFDTDPLLVAIEDYHFLLSAYFRGLRIACRPGIDVYYRMDTPSSISRRHDFDLVIRRLVYNLSKVAVKYSVALPTFLCALAVSVSFFYLKRLLGRV